MKSRPFSSPPKRRIARLFAFLLSLVVLALSSAAPANMLAQPLRTVALTGQQAPGTHGSRFSALAYPVLNQAGQTAFIGFLEKGSGVTTGNDTGIWAGHEESLRLVAREGDRPPETPPSARFDQFSLPRINGSGSVAFVSTIAGLGVVLGERNEGIWSDSTGALKLVARSGGFAPGAGTKVFGEFFSPGLNDAGQVAFSAYLNPKAVASDIGIWVERNDALNLVARHGMQAPGAPEGAIIESTYGGALGESGEVIFWALTRFSTGSTSIYHEELWVDRQGTQRLIARRGTPAPGAPVGEFFSVFGAALTTAGRIAFIAGLQNEREEVQRWARDGIWVETNGSLQLVARAPDQAPGTPDGTTFFAFDGLRMNRSADTAFLAWLSGSSVTGDSNLAIFSQSNEHLAMVARLGDQPPGISSGAYFWNFRDTQVVFNNAGQVAFLAQLAGGDVNWPKKGGIPREVVNDHGIWGQDRNGVLRLVGRAGDMLDVDDGPGVDLRRVRELRFIGSGGGDGNGPQGFNDLGQLAFGASFNDGSSGIFLSNVLAVPEPPAGLLLLSGLALPRMVRDRRVRNAMSQRIPLNILRFARGGRNDMP